MKYTEEQIEEFKRKADKWDALDEQIAACYGTENENGEYEENEDEDIDLCTIGEFAAYAFGFI